MEIEDEKSDPLRFFRVVILRLFLAACVCISIGGCKNDAAGKGQITRTIHLKHIKPEQAVNILNQVASTEGIAVSARAVTDESVTVQVADPGLWPKLDDVMKIVDVPSCAGLNNIRWLQVGNSDPCEIEKTLTKEMRSETFTAIGEPRTRRLFVMGNQEELTRAAGKVAEMVRLAEGGRTDSD